ncbi:hypothetical protein HanIR_Chr15g0767221 [Helianthus annuus]|nr:hypothetical protein HanIR_Chr15g0767221 [Helianthus annuus]
MQQDRDIETDSELLLQRKKNYLTQKSLMSLEMESQQATEFIPELEFTFTYPF